jgi:hypothetical protein
MSNKKKPVVAKKKNTKPKVDKIEYIIEDKSFGELKIRKTANAWWKDREKVAKLIQGLKMDCKPGELRILAGITKDQQEYFMKVHPEFSSIFDDFRCNPVLRARATVYAGIGTDPNLAFRYLERKAPDEFKERSEVELTKPSLVDDMFDEDESVKK